ncbi:flagellar hook-length control protein FliK [Phenylobacterium sp.]|uniref:flagellar hook-length control protein FliK n=1 Tax=Phenylobacterium sp. TaxID=1871053 RepID=UPI003D2B60ED
MSVGPTPPVGGPPPGPLATGQAVSAAATPLAQAPDPVAPLMQRAVEAARADGAIRQSGQGPLLADLSRALESPHMPATLKAAIRQLLAFGLNAGAPPDAAALRAAVARSGLFLEARLAQTPTAPPYDMKAALLALSQALTAAGATSPGRPARATAAPPTRGGAVAGQAAGAAILRADDPPEQQLAILRDETDQALARQTLHQLASLPDDSGQRWMFELPMMTPQGAAVAQFAIERDDPGPGGRPDAAPAWRARFALDIPPLGPVLVHVRLQGERSTAVLWVDRAESLAHLREQAPRLAQALSGDVVVHPGAPPSAPPPAPGALVDRSS